VSSFGSGVTLRKLTPSGVWSRGSPVEIQWQRSVSRFADTRVMREEVSVTTRNVTKQANALAKARERRRELDKGRDEQDRRVEDATAAALVAMDVRKAAEISLREATKGLADALGQLVGPGVSNRARSGTARARRDRGPAPDETRGGEPPADQFKRKPACGGVLRNAGQCHATGRLNLGLVRIDARRLPASEVNARGVT
jgi:hypothetical protein